MSLVVVIDADRFELSGRAIRDAQSVAVMHGLLGLPDRIEPAGPPAPFGHRNNQIHFYDRLGLYLNEHHYTCLVQAITFVLWREEAAFVPVQEFDGDLRVGGTPVTPGMFESDMHGTAIPFVSQLRGTWHFKSDHLWIGYDSKGPKRPSGRRSKNRRLISLSVCLKHDPWDTRRRAENRE